MRPPKVEDQQLLEGLMGVLRSKGYDGASLNELAGSSGLKKASLYHRFPGGKKEITSAVLKHVDQWLDQNLKRILMDDSLSPTHRLAEATKNIEALYDHGNATCILRALSMDSGVVMFEQELKQSIQKWIDGFDVLGQAYGYSAEESRQKALQVITNVQGSLVVSKAMGSNEPFKQAMEFILSLYKVSKK